MKKFIVVALAIAIMASSLVLAPVNAMPASEPDTIFVPNPESTDRPEDIATREEYANLVQSLFGTDDLEPSSLIWLEKGLIETAQATTAEDTAIIDTIYYDGVHLDGISPDEPATPEFIVTTLFALFARGADFTTTAEYLSADADEWLHERKESLSPKLFDKIMNNETLTRAEMCELVVDLAEIS